MTRRYVDPSSCGDVEPEQLEQCGMNHHINNIDEDVCEAQCQAQVKLFYRK